MFCSLAHTPRTMQVNLVLHDLKLQHHSSPVMGISLIVLSKKYHNAIITHTFVQAFVNRQTQDCYTD